MKKPFFALLFLLVLTGPVLAESVEVDLTTIVGGFPSVVLNPIASFPAFEMTISSLFGGNVTQTGSGLGSDLFGDDQVGFGEVLRFAFVPEIFVEYLTLRDAAGNFFVVAVDFPDPSGVQWGWAGDGEYQIIVDSLARTLDITSLWGKFSVSAIGFRTDDPLSAVPEPATLLLLASGLLAGGARLRKR